MSRNNDTRERVFRFVVNYREQYGVSPSYREIGEALNIKSSSTVAFHVHKLLKAKRLRYRAHWTQRTLVQSEGDEDVRMGEG